MCFPGRGSHITSDMCFLGRGTHITRDMCSPHISLVISVPMSQSQNRSSVPVANELMNSLIKNDFICWFNNPFIKWTMQYSYSPSIQQLNVDLITVFWQTTLSTSRPQYFFPSFFLRVECMRFLKFKPKQPNLLENTMVKLRSVYVQWLVDFDPRPLSVFYISSLSILANILIKGNEKRNRKW